MYQLQIDHPAQPNKMGNSDKIEHGNGVQLEFPHCKDCQWCQSNQHQVVKIKSRVGSVYPGDRTAVYPEKAITGTKYKGVVATSDILGAGTDAKVKVILIDCEGTKAGPFK